MAEFYKKLRRDVQSGSDFQDSREDWAKRYTAEALKADAA
jgi:hypothetical protein